MSYLLEMLGRGLLSELRVAFEHQLPTVDDDELPALRKRRADSPRSADLAIRLGIACLRNMRYADARQAFESAAELAPASPQPALGLACVFDELGQLDEALRQLSIAQAHDPTDPAIAFGIAFTQERRGDGDAAHAGYLRTISVCPQLRNAHERLAAIAVQRGDWEAAIRHYQSLTELEPGDLDLLLTLGNLYLQQGRPDDAISQYQRALLIEPDADSEADVAADSTNAEELHEAAATLERLVAKYPGVATFQVHLGDVYAKLGDDELAMNSYAAALTTQPDFLEATVKLGTQHLRHGRFVDAAQAFNRAVELNDRLVLAFVGLGMAQHASGQQREAAATLDLAASLEPSSTLLFSEAARLHLAAQQPDHDDDDDADETLEAQGAELLEETIQRHRQAMLMHPNHADLHYRYGLLLRQAGRFDEAIVAFQRATTINPSYAKALIKLGISLKEAGRFDDAIGTFQQALTLGKSFVDVHYQLGLLFAQRNRFDLAVEQFEHAVAGNEQNTSFRANLALALQNVGMVDRAAATWRSICELAYDTDATRQARETALRAIQRD